MIYKVLILISLLTPFTDSFRSGVRFSNGVDKRIERNLDKFFDKEEHIRQFIQVPDTILSKTNSYFFNIQNQSKTKKAYMVITIANGCRIGGCDVEHELEEEFEQFCIFSIFNPDGELMELKIIEYQSEHGYEVTSKWWLKLFVKYQEEDYQYSKNIDAISGATISVKSMIREMTYLKSIMPVVIK